MRTGIWLDKQNAFIVKINQDVESLVILKSEIGNKGFEKDLHQLRKYSNNILQEVDETDELLIIGPTEVSQYFRRHIEVCDKVLFEKIVAIKKEESMTENRIKTYVKDFFVNEIKV